MKNVKFQKILEPYKIGKVTTRNRIVKTGATMHCWEPNAETINPIIKAFYEALARGGVGLIVVESPVIDYPLGARWSHQYRLDDDKYINGMRELVDLIHKHNCPTFMQMCHVGPWRNPLFAEKLFDGPPIAASAVNLDVPTDFHGQTPRELSKSEIQEIITKFAEVAERGHKAGFDGIDINAGSSHLVHSFLSPFWNKRLDEYGGNTENRTRFLREIIQAVKAKVGTNFPVMITMNGTEVGSAIGINNNLCLNFEESCKAAKLLENAGCDAIQVRNHWLGYHVGGFKPDKLFYPEPPIPLKDFPKEYYWKQRGAAANLYMAEGLKKQLSIPIIIVGKINPELGEIILQNNSADFIGMTRSLFADTELPNKLASGRFSEIAPCTACGTCLDATLADNRRCRINPSIGTTNYIIEKATSRKRVLIIGGGPAGMEAARVAAIRGHEVILCEKSRKLGGSMLKAAVVKGLEFENLLDIIRYYKNTFNVMGVKIKLGKKIDELMVDQIKPDVIIVATGGILYDTQQFKLNTNKIITTCSLSKTLDLLLRLFSPGILHRLTKIWVPMGKRVAIIGGTIHGMEIAEFLIRRGKKIHILESTDTMGRGMIDFLYGLLSEWLLKKKVNMINNVDSLSMNQGTLDIRNKKGETQKIQVDTILTVSPVLPDNGLVESLKGKYPEVYAIGDCKEPRLIVDAIADAWKIAKSI